MKVVLSVLGVFGLIILVGVLMAFPVMWLWNWLMPDLFDLGQITAWQALGLNMLCSILFKANSSK